MMIKDIIGYAPRDLLAVTPLAKGECLWLLTDHPDCDCDFAGSGRVRLTRCSRIGLYTSCEACGSDLSRYADSGVGEPAEMLGGPMSRWQIIESSF